MVQNNTTFVNCRRKWHKRSNVEESDDGLLQSTENSGLQKQRCHSGASHINSSAKKFARTPCLHNRPPTTLFCEVGDMDTLKEFNVEVNGKLIYSCPNNKANDNYTYRNIRHQQQCGFGQNTVRLLNPTPAACRTRNTKIIANGNTIIDDATGNPLQNWGGRIFEKSTPSTLGLDIGIWLRPTRVDYSEARSAS